MQFLLDYNTYIAFLDYNTYYWVRSHIYTVLCAIEQTTA